MTRYLRLFWKMFCSILSLLPQDVDVAVVNGRVEMTRITTKRLPFTWLEVLRFKRSSLPERISINSQLLPQEKYFSFLLSKLEYTVNILVIYSYASSLNYYCSFTTNSTIYIVVSTAIHSRQSCSSSCLAYLAYP